MRRRETGTDRFRRLIPRFGVRTLLAILTAICVYFASYVCFVEVDYDWGFDRRTGFVIQHPRPQYRIGGQITEIFFLPAHQLDRLARGATWADRGHAPFF